MGIGRFFKSLVNAEVMAEEIIKSIIQLYEETARYSPGDSPQDLLVKTYLSRLRARGIDIEDERLVLNAMSETMLYSQLPEGQNIKALALFCLFKERPDIIEAYPKFATEYERLMAPVLEPASSDEGDLGPLESRNENESAPPDVKSVETTGQAERRSESGASTRDGSIGSEHEITVESLTEFILESKTARRSITTQKEMIDTLTNIPQFSRLPEKYQTDVLNIVEEEYPEPLIDQDEPQLDSDTDGSNWAVIHYGEGFAYDGTLVDGEPEGWGQLIFDDGATYEGEWQIGKRHGTGTLTLVSGERYEGEWKNNEKSGVGTYTWPSGTRYEGEYKDGEQHGTGTYTWPDGERYEGEWKNGEQHGTGTFTWPSGMRYEGEWKNGEQHGTGTLTLVSGEQIHGRWKKGERME